ncbi:helix-turn-helix domain-containing protein [Niabella hibiscisoli]|uniref:hypothetical protein n=1 Tax=Niabella hibiscisoli TaxID=1825928 RepID=UPI001F0DC610|nr:hypothetical protein [Niabella hibiscisoli]MCH5718516.1 hypothetical protein [Niabella hibiscisoli]
MGTKSDMIPVYTVDVFATDKTFFWMGGLGGILNDYPHLLSPHKQMFYTLVHVEEPGGHMLIDDETVPLTPANVICIKPGSIVQVDVGSSAAGSIICFAETFFSLRYNSNVLQRFAFLNREAKAELGLGGEHAAKWDALVALMLAEYQGQRDEQVLRSYLNIILIELERCIELPLIAEKKRATSEKVIQFERMVEEQHSRLKTPAAYAAQLYISTNYLNKLCQEHRSITAGELIRNRIILKPGGYYIIRIYQWAK